MLLVIFIVLVVLIIFIVKIYKTLPKGYKQESYRSCGWQGLSSCTCDALPITKCDLAVINPFTFPSNSANINNLVECGPYIWQPSAYSSWGVRVPPDNDYLPYKPYDNWRLSR